MQTAAQFLEIDIEHHDNEQKQHRDRADIDDDQNHRQELSPGDQEQGGGVEERQDQEQHRMHGIARQHDSRGQQHQNGGEQIEEKIRDHR